MRISKITKKLSASDADLARVSQLAHTYVSEKTRPRRAHLRQALRASPSPGLASFANRHQGARMAWNSFDSCTKSNHRFISQR